MSGFAFDVAAAFLGSFAALMVTAAVLIRLAPKLMRSAMRPGNSNSSALTSPIAASKPTTLHRPAAAAATPTAFQWPQPPNVSNITTEQQSG